MTGLLLYYVLLQWCCCLLSYMFVWIFSPLSNVTCNIKSFISFVSFMPVLCQFYHIFLEGKARANTHTHTHKGPVKRPNLFKMCLFSKCSHPVQAFRCCSKWFWLSVVQWEGMDCGCEICEKRAHTDCSNHIGDIKLNIVARTILFQLLLFIFFNYTVMEY